MAVRAAYSLAEAYEFRGKSAQALAAYADFLAERGFQNPTDDARRVWSELAMAATFRSAKILEAQQKWPEATAAFKAYLTRFPDGPQSADAQRALLDVELAIGSDHLNHRRFDQARALWLQFSAQNPLDPRVPDLLFSTGNSYSLEKQFDKAIATWDSVATKFPERASVGPSPIRGRVAVRARKGSAG